MTPVPAVGSCRSCVCRRTGAALEGTLNSPGFGVLFHSRLYLTRGPAGAVYAQVGNVVWVLAARMLPSACVVCIGFCPVHWLFTACLPCHPVVPVMEGLVIKDNLCVGLVIKAPLLWCRFVTLWVLARLCGAPRRLCRHAT